MDPSLLLSLLCASGLLLLFLGIDLMVSSRTLPLEKRMGSYVFVPTSRPAPTTEAKGRKGEQRTSPSGAARGIERTLASELSRAGLPLTVNEYALVNLLIVGLAMVIGFVLFRQALIVVLLLGILGLLVPRWYVRFLQNRRVAAFDGQLAGTLTLLANALRSGYGFSQAVDTVANEAAQPTSTEFRRISREVALGLSMEDALGNLLRRNPSLDLELVVMAININRQTGGNLSEVLDQIASTIRDRVHLMGELRSLTSQQRFTAVVLALLPPALMLFIYVANPTYLAYLWENTCGWVLLAVGATLMVIGFFVIRRIMAIKF